MFELVTLEMQVKIIAQSSLFFMEMQEVSGAIWADGGLYIPWKGKAAQILVWR